MIIRLLHNFASISGNCCSFGLMLFVLRKSSSSTANSDLKNHHRFRGRAFPLNLQKFQSVLKIVQVLNGISQDRIFVYLPRIFSLINRANKVLHDISHPCVMVCLSKKSNLYTRIIMSRYIICKPKVYMQKLKIQWSKLRQLNGKIVLTMMKEKV